jgi:MoaA/NifB/PqqE/SkfB family radical SAM enzyme
MGDSVNAMTIVESDPRFDRRFKGRLMQVFLYVTDECNLRCTQCFYKPSLKKSHAEMPTNVLLSLLRKFRELGAIKVSFLGGEPTLYGQAEGNQPLPFLIRASRDMGFEYIRIVTNGLFDENLLRDERLREGNEITFSMDGDTAEVHNALRGRKTFERALRNLQAAVRLGYTVHVTTCAHRGNIGRTQDGTLVLSRVIKWAAKLGVKSVNISSPPSDGCGAGRLDRRGGYRSAGMVVRVPGHPNSYQVW